MIGGPEILTSTPSEGAGSCREPDLSPKEFEALRALIYKVAGIALRDGKMDMVSSRLAKRLRELNLPSYHDYYRHVLGDGSGAELREMINRITTNKTDFFREIHHFDFLRDVIIPRLQKKAAGPKKLRIWSAGCSTGEEPYTLAMVLREHFGPQSGWDIKVLASDIDTNVLARAEAGVYQEDRLGEVPPAYRKKYFFKGTGRHAGTVRVRPDLQELISFRRINLIEDPWPIQTKFDIIFCRNVIIYFDRETQTRLFRRMADYLTGDRHLFLGHSENLHFLTNIYAPVGNTIYQLRGQQDSPAPVAPQMRSSPARPNPPEPEVEERSIMAGEVFASSKPTRVGTVLGSCVAACLFDPVARVGGMNHFMLPDGKDDGLPARYGVHAMELLINEIMRRGGDRRHLQAKVFGGAQIINRGNSVLNVGLRNAEFVKDFLETEGIPIVSKCLGGQTGLHVRFFTATGKVLVKPIDGSQLTEVARHEQRHSYEISHQASRPESDNVVLF